MNRTFKTLSLFFITSAALFSFTLRPGSGIKGTVAPAESAGTVYAISGTDTLKVEVAQGAFLFSDIKPGTYKVTVEAKAPYKNFSKEDIAVKDGEVVDLGAITLAQ
ncbi:MAG: carboxypeptidase regulatory-like domain-containing protein [Niastella sp.]|nr:carboxypeptidase regulatory-like domain-containing protein [Niastella sp.]